MATGAINRHDFHVSWNATLDKGGLVVSDIVEITIDAEAILEDGFNASAQTKPQRFQIVFNVPKSPVIMFE
jgi:hypothetical protein